MFSTPEWLLIDDTSVHQFFAWLKDNYPEELAAQIFKKAGLLGLEETKNRLNGITDLLGREQCCEVINLDIKRHGGWLFYEKSQPVECIRYLIVEKGLSGEKVLEILYNQQDLFYHFNKSRKYGEAAFNQLINKYM